MARIGTQGWQTPKLCAELCRALPHPSPIPGARTQQMPVHEAWVGWPGRSGGRGPSPYCFSLLCPSFPGRPLTWGRARPTADLDGALYLPCAGHLRCAELRPSHPLTHGSGEWSGLPLPQGWAQGSGVSQLGPRASDRGRCHGSPAGLRYRRGDGAKRREKGEVNSLGRSVSPK